jgi:hypothetical protein
LVCLIAWSDIQIACAEKGKRSAKFTCNDVQSLVQCNKSPSVRGHPDQQAGNGSSST